MGKRFCILVWDKCSGVQPLRPFIPNKRLGPIQAARYLMRDDEFQFVNRVRDLEIGQTIVKSVTWRNITELKRIA